MDPCTSQSNATKGCLLLLLFRDVFDFWVHIYNIYIYAYTLFVIRRFDIDWHNIQVLCMPGGKPVIFHTIAALCEERW